MYEGDIIYAAAATLSTNLLCTYIIYRFMRTFFGDDTDSGWKKWLCYALFYVITAAGHLLFHSRNVNILTNLLSLFLITGCYEKKYLKRLLVTLMVYSVNIGMDFLSVHLFTDYNTTKVIDDAVQYPMVIMIGAFEILYEKFFSKNRDEKNMPYKHIIVIISVISIALIYFVEYGIKKRKLLIMAAISIVLIELLTFYLYDVLTGAYHKLQEQSSLEKQILIYSNQLDVLTKSEEKVTAFRHDVKNHLAELAAMAQMQKNEEIELYIREMGVYMENPKELVNTGNGRMDSLLNYLLGQAKNQLKKVDYEVSIPSTLEMSAFDMNVILGNLIENAIEAANYSEQKWMKIQISYEKGILFTNIQNSFFHELNRQEQRLLSTKKEEGHGIGLKNVEKMLEQYHGAMEISNTEDIFEVNVMLYV